MFSIELFGVKTNVAKSAQNLGVIFDKNFTFRSHIWAVCSSCFYHILDLRRIRHHLDLGRAKLLAIAFVSSRLDYCNSLFYGMPDTDLTRLPHVQNRLTHLVTKSPPFTRSVLLLRSLHWLPVRFRILFKINLLIYKTLWEKQPVYLHSMPAASLQPHSLGSKKDNSMSVPRDKTNTGARAFHYCARHFGTTPSPPPPPAVCPCSHFSCYLQQTSEDTSLWLGAFPHRHRHAGWPVDVTELFLQFYCWILIWLSHHWACFAGDIGAMEIIEIMSYELG